MRNSCAHIYSTRHRSPFSLLASPLFAATLSILPPKSPNPGPLLRSAVRAKGKRTLPTERNWDFKTLKLFSSTKFQPGQQRWDSVLGPLPAHLIRRSVPSPSSSSLPFSGSTGGSAISLTPNTAVNSFRDRPWLRYQILRITRSCGGGDGPKIGDGITAYKVVNLGRHYKTINIDDWEASIFIQSGWTLRDWLQQNTWMKVCSPTHS